MSNFINVFSCICNSIRSFAKPVHLVTLLWLFSVMHWFNILVKCFANLYAGADLLLITGQIGISVLFNFSWAMRTVGEGFFCVSDFICRLSTINLHSCIVVFCIVFWNLSVGVLVQFVEIIGCDERVDFFRASFWIYDHYSLAFGDRGGTVVKVRCYKSEGHWFDSRWC